MKYISAGHCSVHGPNYDPGAPGINGRWEANETVILRDAVITEIKRRGYTDIVQDLNSENRNEYFKRIKTGDGSVVVEFHFNAGTLSATGTEALIAVDAGNPDKTMAAEFASVTSKTLGIKNRGAKSEAGTRHKRLGLMREAGIVTLVEVCFISNANDMAAYDKNFETLVTYYADIVIRFDLMIK
ncbi:MAG TPA: N-acetylmuramoyl-L-alanine amidase [Chitinophagaceae bacterium]|jgi:N-acetylmuramoyl-L-alanine amidase|nr:N-acetylmuramoyl-L-alanine amidase [Chitinophagaceae bacterium]